MKSALALIPLVAIFTTGILVSLPESVFAYCVYNDSQNNVTGRDTRKVKGQQDPYWRKSLPARGGKDCCPGKNEECQNATIYVTTDGSGYSCRAAVDAHGWVVISDKKFTYGEDESVIACTAHK